MRTVYKSFGILLILVQLAGCATAKITSQPTDTNPQTSTPLATTIPPTVTAHNIQVSTPTPQAPRAIAKDTLSHWNMGRLQLWTEIDQDLFTLYPLSQTFDYAYAEDGSLWLAGRYGVIHQLANGEQVWYSIKNGLPVNLFYRIAISPTGEVWVGGADNTIFRFDGENWINEGSHLTPSNGPDRDWLCPSDRILGIDFDEDGNVWVMNGQIEIYAHAFGGWVQVPFPKEILPVGGGGGCPIGFRVKNQNDITLKMHGCCMSGPTAIHFNGTEWLRSDDYSAVDEVLKKKMNGEVDLPYSGFLHLPEEMVNKWPFDKDGSLPYLNVDKYGYSIMIDPDGLVWLSNGNDIINNASGLFEPLQANCTGSNPTNESARLMTFGERFFYFQPGECLDPLRIPSAQNYSSGKLGAGFDLDDQNRIWVYNPEKGLIVMENGEHEIISKNPRLAPEDAGGTLLLSNGKVLVGGRGEIWEYDQGLWNNWVLTDSTDIFRFLAEDDAGNIYAATDTGVYKIKDNLYESLDFSWQDSKAFIYSSVVNDTTCVIERNYFVEKNCIWMASANPIVHYDALFLQVGEDGSVIYANNHILSRLKDGKWQRFFFDSYAIDSAAVDPAGNIYITVGSNGLLRLDADIFDVYTGLED